MTVTQRIAALLLTAVTGSALSAYSQEQPLETLPEPPPMPERLRSGEVIEPDITIKQRDQATVYEYRVNNRLYAVKVVPDVGPEYYLVDADGDGKLESRRNQFAPEILIPAWVLFSW